MELCQTESIRVLNSKNRRPGGMDPHLHNRGPHEKIHISSTKPHHSGLFFIWWDASMYQTHPKSIRKNLLHPVKNSFCIVQVFLLGPFYGRAYNQTLLAVQHPLFHAFINIRPFFFFHHIGFYRHMPFRVLAYDGDIHIPVDDHGQGPGDRRSCHNKDVRRLSLTAQAGPLPDTETLLFVYDDKPQSRERKSLL